MITTLGLKHTAVNAVCWTTVLVGTRLHWSTDCSWSVWVGVKRPLELWSGSAVWPANSKKLDKDCSPLTCKRLLPTHSHTHISVSTRV